MSIKLTQSELVALKDCASFQNGYFWKPKTMVKLQHKGLVAFKPVEGRGNAYFVTKLGRQVLSQH